MGPLPESPLHHLALRHRTAVREQSLDFVGGDLNDRVWQAGDDARSDAQAPGSTGTQCPTVGDLGKDQSRGQLLQGLGQLLMDEASPGQRIAGDSHLLALILLCPDQSEAKVTHIQEPPLLVDPGLTDGEAEVGEGRIKSGDGDSGHPYLLPLGTNFVSMAAHLRVTNLTSLSRNSLISEPGRSRMLASLTL